MLTAEDEKLIARAERFAEWAHGSQVRKYSGQPYVVHTKAVAKILREQRLAAEVIAAGHLHDVLEDTDVDEGMLREVFGDKVTDLVVQVTDVSKPEDGNRAFRKEMDRVHLAKSDYNGASIKLADLIDNTADIKVNDPDFWHSTYSHEKRALLEVLTHGRQLLWGRAWHQVYD